MCIVRNPYFCEKLCRSLGVKGRIRRRDLKSKKDLSTGKDSEKHPDPCMQGSNQERVGLVKTLGNLGGITVESGDLDFTEEEERFGF